MEHSHLTKLPEGFCGTCELPKDGSLATCAECGADVCGRCGIPEDEMCFRCAKTAQLAASVQWYWDEVELGAAL